MRAWKVSWILSELAQSPKNLGHSQIILYCQWMWRRFCFCNQFLNSATKHTEICSCVYEVKGTVLLWLNWASIETVPTSVHKKKEHWQKCPAKWSKKSIYTPPKRAKILIGYFQNNPFGNGLILFTCFSLWHFSLFKIILTRTLNNANMTYIKFPIPICKYDN